MSIRVLIVDQHPIHREGLRAILGGQYDMAVAAEAATGVEGLALARYHRPDVALLDLSLPDLDGVDVIREIVDELRCTRAVILTSCEGDEDIYRALRAGARAYLLKTVAAEELLRTIRDVHAGQRRLPQALAARLVDRVHGDELTRREMEVLRLIVLGRRNRHIARTLEISEGTVKGHVKNILGKLHVSDRTQAATVALRRGIVHL
jgi:two-component system, NarL family, response regulator